MDRYLVHGEEYKAVRDAVAKALVDGNIEQIEEVCEVFLSCNKYITDTPSCFIYLLLLYCFDETVGG